MPTRKIKSQAPFFREYTLKREAVNEEERTVELSFSSETQEVERWYGIEVLDHSPGSIRMDRLTNGAPLLFLHSMRDHIGVIEDVSIEKRRGKAVVRFGNSPLAEEKFRDVLDGILTKVSIGYRVFKLVLEERNEDGTPDVHRAVDWEPYEISLLPIGADDSVGVGRSVGESFEIEIEDNSMPKNTTEAPDDQNRGGGNTQTAAPAASPAAAKADVNIIEDRVRSEQLDRINQLEVMGEKYRKFGGEDLAREFIKNGKSPDEMYRAIVERLPNQEDVGSGETRTDVRLDLSKRDLENYSLFRVIKAVMDAKKGDYKAMKRAAFELECSNEIQERMDREANGFYLPVDVMMSRVMNATNTADLIATQHMGDMYIEALRPNSVVMNLGATSLDGLDGNLEIPKELLSPTFGWIGDDDDSPESDGSFGMVKMAPKTLSGSVPLSRRLLKQSSPSVESLMYRSLLRGAALGVDIGILAGTGTNNQPLGIKNMDGVNIQTLAAAGKPTWPELVGFETKIDADDALEGRLAYVTTAGVRGNLKTTPKDAGSGLFLMDGNEANGHPLATTSQLAANDIIFGNWQDVIVGFWGVIDVMPDTATNAKKGGTVLRVFQDADVSVGHAESFCKNG